MERNAEGGVDWTGLPVIATVARLLCRELTLQNEYLKLENRILKEKVTGRLRFTEKERRSLVEAALAMGRSLMKEVVSIVQGCNGPGSPRRAMALLAARPPLGRHQAATNPLLPDRPTATKALPIRHRIATARGAARGLPTEPQDLL